ncbi:MAG: hypothetical protein LBQ87_06925 [Candidatus Fibromonas sp.]|jgi:uncharacterized protein (TIGR02145 family)|nr:hypothetical protein [Candidatus Fibromonas sp.]
MMKTSRFLLAACILLALALTFSCTDDDGDILAKSLPEPEYCIDFVEGTEIGHFGMRKKQFCDPRDGNLYVKVTIGTQTWMAENLNYMMYNSDCGWGPQYNEEYEEIGCETSRIYDWRGAMGACPIGWRLPNDEDWHILLNYVGELESGIKLRAPSGWSPDYNGTDIYGFSALPRPYSNGTYINFWSATAEVSEYGASLWGISNSLGRWDSWYSKDYKSSVRCLLGDDNGASEPYRETDLVASRSTPVTDKRDGRYKEYKTVTITTKTGTLTWMAQNLNYAVEGSKCLFESDTTGREVVDENTPYCDTYGRLYNWNLAINACPAGWRLPSRDEWDALGFDITKLKAISGWDYKKLNGTDDYGLALLPGGYASKSSTIEGHYAFYGNKTNGRWWVSNESETNDSNAYNISIDHNSEYPYWGSNDKSRLYLSVRCVRK